MAARAITSTSEAPSDEVVLGLAGRLVITRGPHEFSMSTLADAAGLTTGEVVERFGSVAQIYRRLAQRWSASVPSRLSRAAEDAGRSPLGRLRAVALSSYVGLDNPLFAAHQLAGMAIDLQDAEMRGHMHVAWGHVREHLTTLAGQALAAGELAPGGPEPARLARIIAGAMEGGCQFWSLKPDGSLVQLLTEDLDALLRPWVTTP